MPTAACAYAHTLERYNTKTASTYITGFRVSYFVIAPNSQRGYQLLGVSVVWWV
ncbi:MAG: hypothetical protein ACYTX0_36805 [Nostoc sp.]